MTIERIIGGVVYEFRDGTPEAVIRKFEASKATGAPAPAPATPPGQPATARPNALLPGAAGQALQGLSMGFSDEAIARMRSLGGSGSISSGGSGDYEDLVKAEREGLRKYAEENPRTAMASELAGGLAPALLTGGAGLIPGATRAAAKTMGPKIAGMLFGQAPSVGRMAAYGTGSGAVSALGTTEKGIEDQGGEMLKGAVAGGATTGTLGLAGKYVAMPIFRKLKSVLGFGDANKMADLTVVRALEKDGLTPDAALAKLQAMARGEMTLADLGENTAALLRRATQAPGAPRIAAKAELAGREIERVPRVSDDLRSLMSGSKDFYTDVQDLIRKRSDDAQSLYAAAYASPPTFTAQTASEINALRNLPSFKEAMKAGSKRMEDLGLDITDPKNTLRGLHETKLALDDKIKSEMSSGNTNQARTLIDMKNRLLGDMEKSSPEYGIARKAYAGDSEMLTAMEEGRKIYAMPEMDMRKLIKRFEGNPSEYDAYRAGISQAMLERLRVGGATADPYKTVLAQDAEQKIRRAFRDDAAFDQFKARLLEERQMLQTEKSGFRRTPQDTDLGAAASGVGAAQALASGNPVAAGMEALKAAMPNVIGMPSRVAAPVTQKLLTPVGKVDAVLDSIMESLKQQEQTLMQASGASGAAAVSSGALAAARPPKQQFPGEEEQPTEPGMAPPRPGLAPPAGAPAQ